LRRKISTVCLIFGFVFLICIAVMGGGLSATPLCARLINILKINYIGTTK